MTLTVGYSGSFNPRNVLWVLSAPIAAAHSTTQFIVASMVTEDAAVQVEINGKSSTAAWKPINNPLFRFLAFMSPTMIGLSAIGVLLLGTRPVDVATALLAFIILLYAAPTKTEIRGALGQQDVQREA